MKVLAISGSLRRGASNTVLLEAVRQLAPPDVTVWLYAGVGALPHFNPDLDVPNGDGLPVPVAELRALVGQADMLLLSAPEYAHGLPGAFKNVLDWLVGSTEFPGKPVAIISPSARAVHAPAQLREVLTTMSARIVESASVVVPLPHREMSIADVVEIPEVRSALRGTLAAMADAVRSVDGQA